MADTLPDFEADYADWTNAYVTTGITVGASVVITNKSSNEVLVVESATKPPASATYGIPIGTVSTGTYQSIIDGAPSGIWLRSTSDNTPALVNVQEN